jgi:hypothetical protein
MKQVELSFQFHSGTIKAIKDMHLSPELLSTANDSLKRINGFYNIGLRQFIK